QLIAPDDPPLAIDRTDPIAIAVEGDTEIEVLLGDEPAQIFQVLRNGRVGMMVREIAVHFGVEGEVLARELRHQRFQRRTGGTVSGIPADTQSFEPSAIDTLEASEYPFDVIVEDLARLDGAGPVVPVARR